MLPEVCEVLDFRSEEQLPTLSRIGTAFFHRKLEVENETGSRTIDGQHRQLQFEGERCRPNVIDVAQDIPLLDTLVELLNAAKLEDIFLCAGEYCQMLLLLIQHLLPRLITIHHIISNQVHSLSLPLPMRALKNLILNLLKLC